MDPPHQASVRPLFEPEQGGAAAQCLILFHGRLKSNVVSERVVIVQILIATGQAINPLPQQVDHRMPDAVRIPGIVHPFRNPLG